MQQISDWLTMNLYKKRWEVSIRLIDRYLGLVEWNLNKNSCIVLDQIFLTSNAMVFPKQKPFILINKTEPVLAWSCKLLDKLDRPRQSAKFSTEYRKWSLIAYVLPHVAMWLVSISHSCFLALQAVCFIHLALTFSKLHPS